MRSSLCIIGFAFVNVEVGCLVMVRSIVEEYIFALAKSQRVVLDMTIPFALKRMTIRHGF